MRKKDILLSLVDHEILISDLDERITIIEQELKKKGRKKNVKVSK